MRNSRRLKRMSRNRFKLTKMNLTSLMDVFTILVFFLLINSGSEVMEAPKNVTLPESRVEAKPRETVVIFVSKDEVLVQGEPVTTVADIIGGKNAALEPIRMRLGQLKERIIGPNTLNAAQSREVTILADKSVPFEVIKAIMSTCTSEGYEKVSLAVTQKAAAVAAL